MWPNFYLSTQILIFLLFVMGMVGARVFNFNNPQSGLFGKASIPLHDRRDVWARLGFRFVWVTLPYTLIALGFLLGGVSQFLWGLPLAVAVPAVGGLCDAIELRMRTASSPPAVHRHDA